MNGTAIQACSKLDAVVECSEKWWKIINDAFQLHLDPMHDGSTVFAIPLERIEAAVRALTFNDEPNAARNWTLRRMGNEGREKEDLAFPDRHILRLAIAPETEIHVPFKLIEKFLQRVDVIVGASVRATNNSHNEIAILPDLGVADRRFQFVAMIIDPFLEIEGQSEGQHGIRFQHLGLGYVCGGLDFNQQMGMGKLVNGDRRPGGTGFIKIV